MGRPAEWMCWTEGMGYISGLIEWDSVRFHHAAQNSVHFKTYEWFIFGIFHLTIIFYIFIYF